MANVKVQQILKWELPASAAALGGTQTVKQVTLFVVLDDGSLGTIDVDMQGMTGKVRPIALTLVTT
jgi:hypothetical protein